MSWDDAAETWDADPAVNAYANAAMASLQEVLATGEQRLQGAHILDFGCGTGVLTALMATHAASVVGFDVSEQMVARLQDKALPNVRALSGSIDRVGSGFDGVTCSSVCAFVPDYPGTVQQLVRRLAPGGWFIQWDWELDPDADEPFGLSREAIHSALSAAGLVDVVVRTGFKVVFEGRTMAPVMGLGRTPHAESHR